MTIIKKIDNFFLFLEKSIVIVLFSTLVFIITGNIISRNLFHVSSNLVLEISPLIVLWLALAGSTIGLKLHRHIKLELVLRFCDIRIRFIAHIVVAIFGMTIMGILFYTSVEFVQNEISIFGSKGLGALLFPAFFALSFFRYFTGIFTPPEKITKEAYGLSRTPTHLKTGKK